MRAMLLAATALAAAPAAAQPFVFSAARDGNVDLYLQTSEGARRLTTDPAADELGRCSPDRRYVVFRRGGGQSGDLYRLDLRTGAELRLTDDPTRDSAAAWSPDGRFIYFTKRKDGFDRIARMNSDGRGMIYLTDGAWHDVVPSVSPDGKSLVFHTYRYGEGSDLEMIDLATARSGRITHVAGASHDYEPFFATNTTVIFSSNRGGGHHRLYVASIAGGEARLLADTGADAWGGRYSPATGDVLFFTGTSNSWRLMRVPLAGGEAVQVIADGNSNYMPDWC